jgi:hypothetical protein
LTVCRTYRQGEPVFPGSHPDGHRHRRSGINVAVSDAEFEDLAGQVRDAITFLASNRQPIEALCEFPGVEGVTLDFGIARRDVYVQADTFPSELIRLAGCLGLEIELTQYPILETDDDGEPVRVSSR